jgi:hypothetical protein
MRLAAGSLPLRRSRGTPGRHPSDFLPREILARPLERHDPSEMFQKLPKRHADCRCLLPSPRPRAGDASSPVSSFDAAA